MPNQKEYKFKEALNGCDAAIEFYMAPADCVVYRVVHDPIHPNDEIPQGLQIWESLTVAQVLYQCRFLKGAPSRINCVV